MKTKMLLIVLLSIFLITPITFAATQSLTFAWDQVLSADFDGWTLYEYNSDGTPTGAEFDIDYITDMSFSHTEDITVPDDMSTTRCYDLDAYDLASNHSDKSNRVCVDIDMNVPPDVPASFSVTINVIPE